MIVRGIAALFVLWLTLETARAEETNQAAVSSKTNDAVISTNAPPAVAPPETAATNAPVSEGLDRKSFEMISKRSIFDPNRRPNRPRDVTPRQPRPRVTDSFTLVGTLSYDKGEFAVFDGSGSQYKKNLQVSESIAGYKLLEIAHDYVMLGASSNKTVRIPVGGQLRRGEGEKWTYRAPADAVAEDGAPDSPVSPATATTADASAAGDKGAAASPPSAAESDIIKRLMARRASEK